MARKGDSGAHLQSFTLMEPESESALVRSIYYGKIGKGKTERLLERHGREGSFLLRDSESLQGMYCLCVRKTPYVHTYRIHHSSEGWTLQLSSGQMLQCFGSLEKLIEGCREGVGADSIPPLTHPLDKTQLRDERLRSGRISTHTHTSLTQCL
ncbi:SH2 domain-containing protein 1A-like isoform X2 [Oncorhynchus nerka]|uniref:SH2 domain-containing protein 1A-like isoform X2 n=1 Tax=Oncorhynchus nerka TaxID=8023 RepID=UPI001131078C|nr:SH2 domain-containing protein 1A-like isoform X1 [Oncorhynchus nerka]